MRRSAHAEESHVEVVQALALGAAHPLRGAVRFRESALLLHRHARETVVGRIADDHQNRRLLFHGVSAAPFLLQFRKGERFLRCVELPAGERVGEEYARALRVVVGKRARRVPASSGPPASARRRKARA